jgi:Transcriptional regulator
MVRSMTKSSESAKPLERYLQILEVVGAGGGEVTLADLVTILGLPKTTVYRLLQGLLEVEAISAGGQGRGTAYRVAPRLLRILHLGLDDAGVEVVTQHHLQRLSSQTGFTSYIAKLGGNAVRSVTMRTPDASSGIYVMPGTVLAPHASAAGKAIFAYQSEDFLGEALPEPLPRLTVHTLTNLIQLKAEYEAIRRDGFARCRAEDVEGFGALACPISIPALGVAFSVGITGTTDRVFNADMERNVAELKAAAADIAGALQSLPGHRS